jgi:hypothetical protein
VFGIAILGAVFVRNGGVDSPQAFTAGFVPAIGVSACLSLLAAMVAMLLPGRRRVVLLQAPTKA